MTTCKCGCNRWITIGLGHVVCEECQEPKPSAPAASANPQYVVTSHDKHVTGFARIGETYTIGGVEFVLLEVRDGNLVFGVKPPPHQIGVRIVQLNVEDLKP